MEMAPVQLGLAKGGYRMKKQTKYVVAQEVRDQSKPRAIFVNAQGRVRFNGVSWAALLQCNQPPHLFAGFEPLTESRWAVDLVPKGTAGASAITRSKNNKTATTSFGAVLADRPDLKVEKGRQRQIPWIIDPETNRFVLLLDQEENIPSPKRGSAAADDAEEEHPAKLEA